MKVKETRIPHLWEAFLTLGFLVAMLAIGIIVFGVDPNVPMLLGTIGAALMALRLGFKWEDTVTIIASVNPLEAVIAADKIKLYNSHSVKTVYYCADTLSNEMGDSSGVHYGLFPCGKGYLRVYRSYLDCIG